MAGAKLFVVDGLVAWATIVAVMPVGLDLGPFIGSAAVLNQGR